MTKARRVSQQESSTIAAGKNDEPVKSTTEREARPRSAAARLGVLSLGVAIGATSAFFTLLIGITAGLFGWGMGVVIILSSLYIGYEPTLIGSITGAVWAFFDGFIGGAMIAILYNWFLKVRR